RCGTGRPSAVSVMAAGNSNLSSYAAPVSTPTKTVFYCAARDTSVGFTPRGTAESLSVPFPRLSNCSLNWHNCDHMDIQLGYALLSDGRVPIQTKLIALAI